ncbi:MAG: efflux transporter periplasmic adaptor subunit, partial [Pseudomonadales bacterium]|nr:efflux transporter periplasmic adaptor subunit [Pseudomonadales bacterium]
MNPAPELRIADTSGQDVSLEPTFTARRKWIAGAIAIALIAVGMLAWPAFERWRSAETSVSGERLRYGTVTRGDFVRDISVQGRVVAGVSTTLYASQAGTVT